MVIVKIHDYQSIESNPNSNYIQTLNSKKKSFFIIADFDLILFLPSIPK